MVSLRSANEKPLRSAIVEALRAVFFTVFLGGCGYELVAALVTGRTIFPVRENDVYVTLARQPAWYAASVVAWLLMFGFMAYASLRCWIRFRRAIHSPPLVG
jgi:hypothetical protein